MFRSRVPWIVSFKPLTGHSVLVIARVKAGELGELWARWYDRCRDYLCCCLAEEAVWRRRNHVRRVRGGPLHRR